MRADFRTGEPRLSLAGGSTLSLSLTGVGTPTAVAGHGNRVTLTRPGISEWYAAGPLGIEQGFTLAHRPAALAAGHQLTLPLAVGGSLRAQAAGSAVNFLGSHGDIVARYGGLTAVDATGRHLPGALSVSHGKVVIGVNDRGARYPITIDPLVQQAQAGAQRRDVQEQRQLVRMERRDLGRRQHRAHRRADMDNARHRRGVGVHTLRRSTWTAAGPKLVPNDPAGSSSDFGISVALSADGNTALIGGELDNGVAPARRGCSCARAQRGPSSSKLTGDGELGAADFGHSVALSADGNTALVGGPADQGNGSRSGALGVHAVGQRPGASRARSRPRRRQWHDQQRSAQRWRCPADGNTALIGGPQDNGKAGAAWVYTRSAARPGPRARRSTRPTERARRGCRVRERRSRCRRTAPRR